MDINNNETKYLYVILTQSGTYVSRVIKFFTKAQYNHAAITDDKTFQSMYSFGRLQKRPLPGGFTKEDINKGVLVEFDEIPCEIYQIAVTDEEYLKYKKKIAKFQKNSKLMGYNIIGLFTIKLGRPRSSSNKFFCSQFVAYMLEKIGIHKFEKSNAAITPDDFRHIERLELIYEGNIREANIPEHLLA